MTSKYVKKDSFGNIGGVSSYWRWYTELPSGIRLVEKGKQPSRPPDNEKTWYPSAFHYGGIVTCTWRLTESELRDSIGIAFQADLVYVGVEHVEAAIQELAALGFDVEAGEWANKGYLEKI